jgi:hypothetical protein
VHTGADPRQSVSSLDAQQTSSNEAQDASLALGEIPSFPEKPSPKSAHETLQLRTMGVISSRNSVLRNSVYVCLLSSCTNNRLQSVVKAYLLVHIFTTARSWARQPCLTR